MAGVNVTRLRADAVAGAARVRPATGGDAAAIAEVHGRTWQIAYAHIFPRHALARLSDAMERRTQYWRGVIEIPAPRSRTLVAEIAEHVVGFGSVGPTRDDDLDPEQVGELYAIYVAPEAWGQGVGRSLMGALVRGLREERFTEATLWVLEDNPRTRRFYERAGWRADGAAREATLLDTAVRELRYRIVLGELERRTPRRTA